MLMIFSAGFGFVCGRRGDEGGWGEGTVRGKVDKFDN